MLLGRYIYGKLSTTTAVTDLVGERIFPVYVPQNETYPCITYMVDNAPLDSKMKDRLAYHDRATVTFHVWADHAQGQQGYDDLDDIDAAIRAALDFVAAAISGIIVETCKYENSRDGRDDDRLLILREITYTFTTKN